MRVVGGPEWIAVIVQVVQRVMLEFEVKLV